MILSHLLQTSDVTKQQQQHCHRAHSIVVLPSIHTVSELSLARIVDPLLLAFISAASAVTYSENCSYFIITHRWSVSSLMYPRRVVGTLVSACIFIPWLRPASPSEQSTQSSCWQMWLLYVSCSSWSMQRFR